MIEVWSRRIETPILERLRAASTKLLAVGADNHHGVGVLAFAIAWLAADYDARTPRRLSGPLHHLDRRRC